MEAFYTLQGEGAHQGKAAYFIRLGGCDVGCHWCDVKESWDAKAHPQKTVVEIVEEATQYPSRLAVITGGEPLIYDLTVLTQELKQQGFSINIETSGTHLLSGQLDWVCFSPKKFKAPLPEIYERAHELKIIIYNRSDFRWAEQFAEKMNAQCQLYLQPEWSVAEKRLPQIIEYIKQNPKWRISLQTHKFMQIP
ncbi:MAG: 7-carboxy-7-deazaguanine synthase QueE [Bacteroidota bacterium]